MPLWNVSKPTLDLLTHHPAAEDEWCSRSRNHENAPSPSTSSAACDGRQQPSTSRKGLHMHHTICHGSEGYVMRGTFDGEAAVVKLLGPDSSGVAAFQKESHAYQMLQHLYGEVAPHLLASGRWPLGVYFIATELVEGISLSKLPHRSIPEGVKMAAMGALAALHASVPGFCHGDISLSNIMLVQSPHDSNAPPQCMLVDFGCSSFSCSHSEQLEEQKELRALLGI